MTGFDNTIDQPGGSAAPGLDHPWFPYSAVRSRPAFTWPDGRKLAVAVVLDLTAVEWEAPGTDTPVRPPGGRGPQPYPDLPRMSHREYGHRVGIFRLLDRLEEIGVRPAVVIDVLTAEQYPRLVELVVPRVGEVIAGGLSGSRAITSRMSSQEEQDYIQTSLDHLESAVGTRPDGWLSPQRSQSQVSPRLLAASGLGYECDWSNDEQPHPYTGDAEGLWSFPLSWELSDLSTCHLRGVSPRDYAVALRDAMQVLVEDGASQARTLGLHLHPWVTGQPFRHGPVLDAVGSMAAHPDVWTATPGELVTTVTTLHEGRLRCIKDVGQVLGT